ncbi:MAG: hypothetical protein E3J72_05170 [Planctomycetota bacterium]|nr:MAG: hypothetical protein E3J72_05170 [Planctomycetota bacterium]
MFRRAVSYQRIVLPCLAVLLGICCGCITPPKQKIPRELKGGLPAPADTFYKLQQFLRAEEYGKAYALFTRQYRDEYAPDLEAFTGRAQADAAKIISGSLVTEPAFAGGAARAVAEYGDEHVRIYFVFDRGERTWLVTSKEHYRFLTEDGDRSTPKATLQTFLRLIATGRHGNAYKMLASELGVTRQLFATRIVPTFKYIFSSPRGKQVWRLRAGPSLETWAVLVVEYPDSPKAPRTICFVKKLDRWYIALEPVGDAAAAKSFILAFRKAHAEKQKKNVGQKDARK